MPSRWFARILLAAVSLTCVGGARSLADRASAGRLVAFGHGTSPAAVADCIAPEQRALVEQRVAIYELAAGRESARRKAEPTPYPFFPQAGTLWQDLFVTNFVDLDASSAVRDWECTDVSYDGHRGHDSALVSFTEQRIGVPVFAALDGMVVDAHDGEFDENIEWNDQTANYVILDHGGGQYAYYWHFKRDSVAVVAGQQVRAGEQLGLTGSSGISTGPHLHFESEFNGRTYEPSAGPCRRGRSYWVEQTPTRDDRFPIDFTFGASSFGDARPIPFDDVPHVGTMLQGERTIHYRYIVGNLPADSRHRFRFGRPDGSIAADDALTFDTPAYRWSWWWFYSTVDLDVTGTWTLLVDVDGQRLLEAPFRVVASAADVVNRPPNAVSAAFDPPLPSSQEAVFCHVGTSLVAEDPDYEVVRYRYQWSVNGATIRDVTTAALSDAIPRGSFGAGDELACVVTPMDASASGPSTRVTAGTVFAPTVRVVSPNGGERLRAGTSVTISWESSDSAGIASHDIFLSTDGGASYPTPIAMGLGGEDRSYAWAIPAAQPKSKVARIRVVARNVEGGEGQDDSDESFRIKKARR
jgi:hypothetical protein